MRVQFIVGRYGGETPQVDVGRARARDRRDRAHLGGPAGRCHRRAGAERAEALLAKYGTRLLGRLRGDLSGRARAARTSSASSGSGREQPVAIDFYREPDAPPSRIHAAVYRFGAPIRLSERVPVLENLGFSAIDERSYHIRPRFADGERDVTLHDMVLETSDGAPHRPGAATTSGSRAASSPCFRGEADNDGFNRLIVSAGADWREAAALRAYAAYLRQLGSPFGLRYLADTLTRHAGLARDLLELFHLRFDPGAQAERGRARRRPRRRSAQRIEGALAGVPSLDEDRILRQVLNLVGATVRTNFYQAGRRRAGRRRRSPSSSTARPWRRRRSRARSARSGSTRRASRACTCASRRSRAAASAGRTGRRTSAPRCWGWCARSSSRTR